MTTQGTRYQPKKCDTKPILTFSHLAWEKMWALTNGNREGNKVFECTSLGIMHPRDACKVLDIWVPKQKNTGSSTDADDDDKLLWVAECVAKGIDPAQLNFWHHTHADFSVFWSGTDISTIERLQGDRIQWSVVTNTKGDIKIRADMFSPLRLWWDDCDYEVEYPELEGIDEWFAQVKEEKIENTVYTHNKVVKKGSAPTPKRGPHNGYGAYGGYPQYGTWRGGGGKKDNDEGGKTFWSYADFLKHQEEMSEEEKYAALGLTTPDKTQEVLHLSHPLIQEVYDNGIISQKEAEELEHSFLTQGTEEDDLIETLRTYASMGGAYTFQEGTDSTEEDDDKPSPIEEKVEEIIETYLAVKTAGDTQDLNPKEIIVDKKEKGKKKKEKATTE